MKTIFNTAALTLIVITMLTSDIFAIPAFARKYNMTCKTCHSPFPNLKPYGDEFAGNGFVLKDQDAPRYFIDTGDPELSLIRDLPLAIRIDGNITFNKNNNEQSDFGTPVVFKLLSGGSLTKDVAYYVYYILENGKKGKIEDALLMFNNLFGSELDLTVGQFQVSDPLFKRELRLTNSDYYIYKIRPGTSLVDLAYDRGIVLSYGFESGTDISLLIVNGTGIGEEFLSGTFDNDKYKNFMGRISQDINENLRLGTFGYLGKAERLIPLISGETLYPQNETWMLGVDATFSLEPLELNVQYIERDDDNPFFLHKYNIGNISGTGIRIRGGFMELVFKPNGDESKWYAVALYNYVNLENHLLERVSKDVNSLAVHFGYLLKRNIRLTAEYSHDFNNKYGEFGLGFVTAF